MLLAKAQLRKGQHLQTQERPLSTFKKTAKGRPKTKRYTLIIPDTHNPLAKTSNSTLKTIFGGDDLGAKALALFQPSLQPSTHCNYGFNMSDFFRFCEDSDIPL